MRRALRVLFVGVPLSAMALVLLDQPASAQGFECRATMNGVDSNTHNTPKRALRVRHDQRLAVGGTAELFSPPSDSTAGPGVLAYLVKLELAGASWTATSGVSDKSSWSGTVNVADYATRGQGIYKVVAVTKSNYGDECFRRAYIKVEGDGGALSTTAGQVAAGIGGAALLGAGAAAARGGKDINEDLVAEKTMDWIENQAGGEPPPESSEAADREKAMGEMKRSHGHEVHLMSFCLPLVVVAAAATVKAVVSDVGRNVVAAIGGLVR